MLRSFRWVLALTVTLAATFAATAAHDGELDPTNRAMDVVLIALNTVPLLALRRNPVAVVLVLAVVYPVWLGLGPLVDLDREGNLWQSLPTLVAMYAAGSSDRPLWVRTLALLSPVWMMAAALVGMWAVDAVELSYVFTVLVIVWMLGVVVAGRRSYAAQLEAKTELLEEARVELAERAVVDERARIARELHDVVAHAMSVITVQAGVAAHLLDARSTQAREALSVIERTGREALAEMRRMLVMLRDEHVFVEDRLHPQPGLGDLPELVAAAAAAGVPVTVQTEGRQRQLPAGLDLVAFRVVQEALTNVAKHAPGARAVVRIRYRGDVVTVEVADHGGPSRQPVAWGHGLRGMAERVALYDGRLDVVDGPQGFRVITTFPLDVEPAAERETRR